MSTTIAKNTLEVIKNQIGHLISKEDEFKKGKSYHEFGEIILHSLDFNLNSAIAERTKAKKIASIEYSDIFNRIESATIKFNKLSECQISAGSVTYSPHKKEINELRGTIEKLKSVKSNFLNSKSNLNFEKSNEKVIKAQKMVTNIKSAFANDLYKNELIEYIDNLRIHFPEPLGNLNYSLLALFTEGDSPREQREQDLRLLADTMNKKDGPAYAAVKDEFMTIMHDYNNTLKELSITKNTNPQDYDDFIKWMDDLKNKEEYKILSKEFIPKEEKSEDLIFSQEIDNNMGSLVAALSNPKGDKETTSSFQKDINMTQNKNFFFNDQTQFI
ncbi:hypothetical protein [Yersinia mollaretii]|uniref:hypothetical protein n=1 Tax=Yersinia mollaretii TaxID=33060 RepID=UPI0011A8F9A9|nr:hypothetical protein [Yersinia mollaretii]MDN0111125.1 hypothetical protein [Yersinia mollaretii]